MNLNLEQTWKELLTDEFEQDYYLNLSQFLGTEYKTKIIHPPQSLIFNAFNHCKVNDVKVVLIGQDPYHGEGQAHGLSFSVNDGVKFPPSLRNIFKELKSDLNVDVPFSGNLERWAEQGVLLLNATLTVQSKTPGSHQKKGWELFTDAVIQKLSDNNENIVFILWGAYAQKKGLIIDKNKHHVIESAHPSPFSAHRGFFGSKPFSKTNTYLESIGKEEIDW